MALPDLLTADLLVVSLLSSSLLVEDGSFLS
jgi:hypothetical protein